jgi:hypothetical protein
MESDYQISLLISLATGRRVKVSNIGQEWRDWSATSTSGWGRALEREAVAFQ